MNKDTCACGSGRNKSDCCVALIEGRGQAVTAEALMRSRYVAFTLTDTDYLIQTHHPITRKPKELNLIKDWAKLVSWMGLRILKTERGKKDDTTGIVEFRAVYLENGSLQTIHEISKFEKVNERWFYLSGIHL